MITFTLLIVGIVGAVTTPSASAEDIYGIHASVIGTDFTMECNCQHPSDRTKACTPTCCLLVAQHRVERIRIVGRCRELPNKPLIYRVSLSEGTKTSAVAPPAKRAERNEATAYLFDVKDDSEIEIAMATTVPNRTYLHLYGSFRISGNNGDCHILEGIDNAGISYRSDLTFLDQITVKVDNVDLTGWVYQTNNSRLPEKYKFFFIAKDSLDPNNPTEPNYYVGFSKTFDHRHPELSDFGNPNNTYKRDMGMHKNPN